MNGEPTDAWSGIQAEVREGGRLDPDVLRRRAREERRRELARLLEAAAAALAQAARLLRERVSRYGARSVDRTAGRGA